MIRIGPTWMAMAAMVAVGVASAQPRGDVDFEGLRGTQRDGQVAAVRGLPRAPTAESVAQNIEVKGQLLPMGDFVVLALDITNQNPESAVLFDQANVVLVDEKGTELVNDPWHPLLNSRARTMLFTRTRGTFYQSFHTVSNAVHAGASDHFVGTWKPGKLAKGRITLRYFVPQGNGPTVTKEFELAQP